MEKRKDKIFWYYGLIAFAHWRFACFVDYQEYRRRGNIMRWAYMRRKWRINVFCGYLARNRKKFVICLQVWKRFSTFRK